MSIDSPSRSPGDSDASHHLRPARPLNPASHRQTASPSNLFPDICLTDFRIKNISRISKFIPLFAFPFSASSSSSSPSELSEGPASDGSSQALATRGSNQQDSPGVLAAAGSSQAAGPKSGPTSSVSVAIPAPRITPANNGPLPPG